MDQSQQLEAGVPAPTNLTVVRLDLSKQAVVLVGNGPASQIVVFTDGSSNDTRCEFSTFERQKLIDQVEHMSPQSFCRGERTDDRHHISFINTALISKLEMRQGSRNTRINIYFVGGYKYVMNFNDHAEAVLVADELARTHPLGRFVEVIPIKSPLDR